MSSDQKWKNRNGWERTFNDDHACFHRQLRRCIPAAGAAIVLEMVDPYASPVAEPASANPGGSGKEAATLVCQLAKVRPWAMFFGVTSYVWAAWMAFSGIYLVHQTVRWMQEVDIHLLLAVSLGAAYGGAGLYYIWVGITFFSLSSMVAAAVQTAEAPDLAGCLHRQYLAWRRSGIGLLLTIVLNLMWFGLAFWQSRGL